MDTHPSFRQFLPGMLTMVLLGWGGFAYLIFFTLPTVWMRWLFFIFWMIAITGTALPIAYLLHRRFPSNPPVTANVVLRQSMWAGIYGVTLAWLQLGRVVTLWLIFGLAAGFFFIEMLTRMRERARWQPPTRVRPRTTPAPQIDKNQNG